MDYQLLALIALIVAVVIAAIRQHSRSWRGRRGWQYQRVFSVGFAGLLFFVSGVVGWDVSYGHEWFHGTKWVGGLVWWQIGLGGGLLMLAAFWARRVPMPPAVR